MKTEITRRQMLTGAALAAAAGAANGIGKNLSALASITVGPRGRRSGSDTLVVLFLRGGADGLNMIVPYGDEDYYRLRPSLALSRPNDRTETAKGRVLDLNGFFGLHPSLASLLPLYQSGKLLPFHAVGSGDQTLSHFEAMATMERGLAAGTGTASGWLARHLNSTADEHSSPLRSVALSETMPDSLRGTTSPALTSLADYRLVVPDVAPTGAGHQVHHAPPAYNRANALTDTLHGLYSQTDSSPEFLRSAGIGTLAALNAVKRLDPEHYRPDPAASYPAGPVGNGFRQAACLIKGEVGLEVACLDMSGWDTHVAQGRDSGWQPLRLAELGSALAAFAADLGSRMSHVTTIVMTEFGRRAYENTGLGTDHGHATCMLLMGGGIQGGKVHAKWPGLADHQLDATGNLRVTTDYRNILAEIVKNRLNNPDIATVFPGYTSSETLDLFGAQKG